MSSIKRMFALIKDVATTPIGGVWMALFFHILVT